MSNIFDGSNTHEVTCAYAAAGALEAMFGGRWGNEFDPAAA